MDCVRCNAFSKSVFSCASAKFAYDATTNEFLSINFKKGQNIFTEGEFSKGVFCIQEGTVALFKTCSGRNISLDLVGRSALIGHQFIYTESKYMHSARCLTDVEACFIPRDIFLNIINNNNELLIEMVRRGSAEYLQLADSLRDMKCMSMLGRVAKALLFVSERIGTDKVGCLDIYLTRKDISEMAGTTTASVIRILSELKREKVICYEKNRIKIVNINALNRYLTYY